MGAKYTEYVDREVAISSIAKFARKASNEVLARVLEDLNDECGDFGLCNFTVRGAEDEECPHCGHCKGDDE